MKGIWAIISLALAAGAHAAIWVALPEPQGDPFSGASGQDTLSMAALPANAATLIERWDTAPTVSSTPQSLAQIDLAQADPLVAPVVIDIPNAKSATFKLAASVDTAPVQIPSPVSTSTVSQAPKLETLSVHDPATLPDRIAQPNPLRRVQPLDVVQAFDELAIDTSVPEQAPNPNASLRPVSRPIAFAPAPAPQKQAASTPRAKTVAKGTGTTPKSGNNGAKGTAKTAKAPNRALQAKWSAKIARKVLRSYRWPDGARGGVARIEIKLAPSGKLLGARILKSSGQPHVDKSILTTVRRIGRFAKAPKGLNPSPYTDVRISLRNPG